MLRIQRIVEPIRARCWRQRWTQQSSSDRTQNTLLVFGSVTNSDVFFRMVKHTFGKPWRKPKVLNPLEQTFTPINTISTRAVCFGYFAVNESAQCVTQSRERNQSIQLPVGKGRSGPAVNYLIDNSASAQ